MRKDRLLFLGKKDDDFCRRAVEFIELNFENPAIVIGKRGDPAPVEFQNWSGDYIVSYLSPWIVPADALGRARKASLNFHPGPPQYPGIGCTNFAIYNGEKEFGITCHHMNPRVDTGDVVAVARFPLLATDTVHSLTQRCYAYILSTFFQVMTGIVEGKPLPSSAERWTRKPYTRKELNDLCRVNDKMPQQEIDRRRRAVTFPGMPGIEWESSVGTGRKGL